MNKSLKTIIIFGFYIGLIIWLAILTKPPVLPDFMSGFLSGVSTTFIIIGLAYVAWCFWETKKKRENN